MTKKHQVLGFDKKHAEKFLQDVRNGKYSNMHTLETAETYKKIAKKHGIYNK